MKSIRRIAKTAAAGLVGASLVGGAAAQSNSLDLGDYPAPFVDEDGEVNAAVVVGEQASTIDVVGAINIAGSLGQDAFSTEQVSVEGSSYGFTASQGTSLTTENDDLYFGDSLTEVRDTLTSEQLSTLEEVTFRDDSGDETDIEQYLYPASNAIKFGKPDERDDEDPVVYVENPEDPDNNDFLFRLQANFEDSLNFTSGDVQDEDLELFGNTYQVSSDSDSDEVVLNGARETVSVSTGNESSATVTVGGDEVTFEVVGVTDSDTAAISVNGEVQEEDEDSDFTVNGENVRIDDIIQTNSDNSQGTVQFAVGSDQLVLQDGNTVQDEDGDDIEGLYSELQGTPSSLGGIDLYVGAEDDDQTYVLEGESYTHPTFPDYAFRFGGLNPDTASEDSGAEETEISTSGDETVTVDLNQGGDSGTIEFINYDGSSQNLADDDGDAIKVVEGSTVEEDEYFVSDAGDFTHLWEVTSIDRDTSSTTAGDYSGGDEATVDLRDAVTGDTVEVDLDVDPDEDGSGTDFGSASDIVYEGTEVIDGQTYHFEVEANTDAEFDDDDSVDFRAAFGDGAGHDSGADNNLDRGAVATEYPSLETGNGARISLVDPAQKASAFALGTSIGTTMDSITSFGFINDGSNDGDSASGYQTGDDVVEVSQVHDGNSDISDGGTVNTFQDSVVYEDGNTDDTYSSGESVYDLVERVGDATPSDDGTTYTAFDGETNYIASSGSFDGTQAIIDDDSGATGELNQEEVLRSGSSGVLSGLSGTDLQHYDGDDTNGNDAQYDGDGSGNYNEPIYDTKGSNPGNVEGGDDRITAVTVQSTTDSDAGTIDLSISNNGPGSISSGDYDASNSISISAFASQDSKWDYVDSGNTGWDPANDAGDYLVFEAGTENDAIDDGDIVFPRGNSVNGKSDPFVVQDSSAISVSDLGDNDNPLSINGFYDDSSGSDGSTDPSDGLYLDLGTSESDGDTVGPKDYSFKTDTTPGSGTVDQSVSATVSYWDITNGDSSYSKDDQAIYLDTATAGTDDSVDDTDARIALFDTHTYGSGTTVDSTDADVGASVIDFSGDEYYLDDNTPGSDNYNNGEAIVRDGGSSGSDLETGDTVVVSGTTSNTFDQQFSARNSFDAFKGTGSYGGSEPVATFNNNYGTTTSSYTSISAGNTIDIAGFETGSGNVEGFVDNSNSGTYDDDEEIVRLERYSTTSGTTKSVSADSGVTVNEFRSNTRTLDSGYSDNDPIFVSSDASFDGGDTVLFSGSGGSTTIRRFSTEADETSGVTPGLSSDVNSLSNPGLAFIEEEADDDSQYGYTVTASFDSGEEELQLDSPVYSDSNRQTSTLESNDDVTAGVDFFGTYTEFDDDEQGSFTLRYPDGQAVAGAGFTSTEGSLDTGGSGSTSVQRAAGFPESALLDSEVTQSQRTGTNHILVGGPAVNTLVSDLAEANETMAGSEYSEGDSMIQLVQGAFADGQSSLIVAGFSGEDTRQAANRLANADENPLPGQDQVMVGTGQ